MQLLEDLDIVAEVLEYEEGSDKSVWGEPYLCEIKFDCSTEELRIKIEYELDDGQPTTFVTFMGKRDPSNPLAFNLISNKPDVDNSTIQLETSFDGEFWYFEGYFYAHNDGKIECRDIYINQVEP